MIERRTPLHDNHVRLGAQMVKGGGDFMFPLVYTANEDEHVNARTNVGMQDLSTMGEVDVKGPGAERLINSLTVNDIRNLEAGQARYSTMVNEQGGVVDDITVYKFGDEHFMVVTSSGPRKKTARWISDHAVGASAYVTDITASIALPVIQGQRSRDLLRAILTDVNLDTLLSFLTGAAWRYRTDCVALRLYGRTRVRIVQPAEEAAVVWDQVIQAGKAFGLKPYGVQTMHSLRIEKGFPLYGNDLNENYTPYHAGLERWIKYDKHDFVGRDALLRVQQQGPAERWVCLAIEGERLAAFNDRVLAGGEWYDTKDKLTGVRDRGIKGAEEVGHVTFSARGFTVGKTFAMAYVKTAQAWPGNRLAIQTGNKPLAATVVAQPVFDPQGARLRV